MALFSFFYMSSTLFILKNEVFPLSLSLFMTKLLKKLVPSIFDFTILIPNITPFDSISTTQLK